MNLFNKMIVYRKLSILNCDTLLRIMHEFETNSIFRSFTVMKGRGGLMNFVIASVPSTCFSSAFSKWPESSILVEAQNILHITDVFPAERVCSTLMSDLPLIIFLFPKFTFMKMYLLFSIIWYVTLMNKGQN